MSGRRHLSQLFRSVGILVALGSAAGATLDPVPVAVREPSGVARPHWPLTVSVPMARGALRPGDAVIVREDGGAALPTQSRSLATWSDGSVRWLLVDTQVDLGAGEERHLRVERGTPPPPGVPLHVNAGEMRIDVDTGALRFGVPRDRFALLDRVQVAGEKRPLAGAVGSVLVAGERPGAAQRPAEVRILEQGPLRTRVALTGTYGNGFDYEIRLDVFAGQPFVRVRHTFVDRNPASVVTVPRIAVEWPLGDMAPGSYRAGVVDSGPLGEALPAEGIRLIQRDAASAEFAGNRSTAPLAGWVDVRGTRMQAGVAARWFRQEYPQSFALRRDGLAYNLWAPEADPANAGVGAAKTHEFALWAASSTRVAPGIGAALTEPLVGVVSPSALLASGALPDAGGTDAASLRFIGKAAAAGRRYLERNRREEWNDCGRASCEDAGPTRRRVGAFGMWNWGDWNFRGYGDSVKGTDSWGNLEYDTTAVLARSYAGSGDPALFEALEAAARHYGDVDVIHASPSRPDWVGMNHPKNPLHFSFELGGPDLGHTWAQGLVDYYYLTGDERGLSAARGIADYLVRRVDGVVRGNPRQWGWPQIALLSVFEATGERRYLDAASRYAAGGMAAHAPEGTKNWKLGVLADALAHTHAATGNVAIRDWLQRYAEAIMRAPDTADVRAMAAVAYVGRLTGDGAMRDAAERRAEALELGSWGKPYTINGRIGFRIYSLLR